MKYCIYVISQRNDPTKFYIGSTVNFSRRKSHHKKNTTNKRGKLYWITLYKHIRNNGMWDNFDINIIEEVEPSGGNIYLRQREQWYIDTMKPTLNINNSYKKN